MIGDSRYKIEEEIARGGMGVVLRVKDGDLDRTLAMKRMASAPDETMGGSEGGRFARFMEEAQVTAQLDHPAIVPVHDLGFDEDGTGWYTMKLVEGRELGQVFDLARVNQEGWNEARVLRVLVQVCEALAYAHGKGVLHRDLKPANIMVGEFGEVYVMDWGLARVAGSEVTSPREDDEIRGGGMTTLDGSVMGTPEFMSPEQARGEEVDERSDVYAVGAMLYYFLAGHPPYQGEAKEVVKRVAKEGPKRLPIEVKRELATICRKAMARERGERYGSMAQLGQEIQRFLDGRVVEAYETGKWAEFKKLIARNKAVSAALLGVFLALVGMLVMQGVSKKRIEASQAEAVFALERMAVSQGLNAGEDLDYGKAAYWFHRAEGLAVDEERAATHRVRARIAEERQTEPVRALMVPFLSPGHCRLDFSPDGKFLVVTHHLREEVKQVVDVEGEELMKTAMGGEFFAAVAFCEKTGRVALVAEEESRVCEVFDPERRDEGVNIELERGAIAIGGMAFSRDGGKLFLGAESGRVFDFTKGDFEPLVYEHLAGRRIGYAIFDPSGDLVMTVTHKETVEGEEYSGLRVFEIGRSGESLFPVKETWFWPNLMRPGFLNGGEAVVHFPEAGWSEVAKARTGEVVSRKNEIACDGDLEAELFVDVGKEFRMTEGSSVLDDMLGYPRFRKGRGTVLANRPWLREISLRDGTVMRPVGLNRYEVGNIAVSRDGILVAGWETDGLMRFWSLEESEWDFEMKGRGVSEEVVFSSSGRWVTGVSEGKVRVYEVATGGEVGMDLATEGKVIELCFSPDDEVLGLGLVGGRVEFWNWKKGERLGDAVKLPGEVLVGRFSSDGQWWAGMCRSGELVKVDRARGVAELLMKHDQVREKVAAPRSLKGLAFSESGRWLVMWSLCKGVKVWDCERGELAESPPVKEGRFVSLLKVMGERLVFLEEDNWDQVFDVKEWDMEKKEWSREEVDAGRGNYSNLDVSEDGERILLSRMGEEFASLAVRDQEGDWEWRKIMALGRGASFFVPRTSFAVGVTSTGPSRFAMVDLRDGSELAAPLANEVSMFHLPKMSPDGRRLAAVDWSGTGVGKVWNFSVLDEKEEMQFSEDAWLVLSELNAGGRDGEIGWEELRGEEWLRQWREFRSLYPDWHLLPKKSELRE